MTSPSLTSPALVHDGIVFGAAFAATALMTPLARRAAIRFGIMDRPAPNKFHQQATPYLGGLVVAGAVLILIGAEVTENPSVRMQILAIGLGGLAVSLVGLIDDWRVLGALPRLAVQAGAGIGLWAAGVRLAPTGFVPLDLAVTVLIVLAVTNAINLLDNMDGLSAGTTAVIALFFFVVAASQGQELVTAMALALAGGCLGFIPYNFHPARIFLGDAGTLFLGFLLSVLFIKVKMVGYPLVTRTAVPLLLVTVPLFDTVLVIVSRWRAGRPVFRGGTDHSSHRLHLMLASPATVAMVTYGAAAASGAVALGLLAVDRAWVSWLVVGAAALACVAGLVVFERIYVRGALVSLEEAPRPKPAGTFASDILAPSRDRLRSQPFLSSGES